jgi:predicted GNAT superfamily acetyltransferase
MAWKQKRERIVMKTLVASVLALGLIATAANAAIIGVHVGPVGVGVGHYHYHNHYYGHRHWEHNHYRYW